MSNVPDDFTTHTKTQNGVILSEAKDLSVQSWQQLAQTYLSTEHGLA
jgi:hypothetical protein